jgi:hypothetical protein
MRDSEVLTALSAVLAPYLGPNMARASVDSNLKRVKPDGGSLNAAELTSLLERLGKGLVVFVGEEKAAAVSEQMRQAVSPGGWEGDATVNRPPRPR